MNTSTQEAPNHMPQAQPENAILQLTVGFWQSRAVAVAAELELADFLADGALSVDELAQRSGSQSPDLFRLLRALESIGIFKQVASRTFANTEISQCLRKHTAGSQYAWVRSQLSAGSGLYEAWSAYGNTVREGGSAFKRVFGQSLWEFYQQHRDAGALFDSSMLQVTQAMTPAVTGAYDWSHAQLIADIGGGIGSQLADILEHNPAVHGILFDLDNVLSGALQHPHMRLTRGDFFKEVPAEADLYLIRTVLHDWGDDEAIAILRVVRKAMQPANRLVLVEMVVSETPVFELGKWADLLMATLFDGGRERTAAEFDKLLQAAGFRMGDVISTGSPLSIIAADPA